ncbi:MAG TPA: M23 family metallopeptidase [Solirubrobacteraceae bacterium]
MTSILIAIVPCSGIAAASAAAEATGGTRAPVAPPAGGGDRGAVKTATAERPVVSALGVPSTAPAGKPPKVTLRIDERGVSTVDARVTVADSSTRRTVIATSLGWVHTGRTVTVGWPRGATLKPGRYSVTVNAHDDRSRTLLRGMHSSGEASLTVTAPAPVPPKPVALTPTPAAPVIPGVPTPAQTAAEGAVFPVAGEHSFGNQENAFGAPRDGYSHQGQDILTAEGTPVVAPLAGTILTTSYQVEGAGYYAVEQTGGAFDFMFAHCMAASLTVSTGQAVTPGQTLCKAGQTGDATAPHLDFEIWIGGWQAKGGEPINPLPYLEAWEHDGAT